jgi:hypothetical protein
MIEELKFLGEIWTINDPTLLRCFLAWTKRNANALSALSLCSNEGPARSAFFEKSEVTSCLN